MKNKFLIIFAGLFLSFNSLFSFEKIDKEAYEQAQQLYKEHGSFDAWKKVKKESFTQQFCEITKRNNLPLSNNLSNYLYPRHAFFTNISYTLFNSHCCKWNLTPNNDLKKNIFKSFPIIKDLCKNVDFCYYAGGAFCPVALTCCPKVGFILIPYPTCRTLFGEEQKWHKTVNTGVLLHELGHIHCGHVLQSPHYENLHYQEKKTVHHLMEHEADLFSYTYCPIAAKQLCNFFYDYNHQASSTHPSSEERYKNAKIAEYIWEFERGEIVAPCANQTAVREVFA